MNSHWVWNISGHLCSLLLVAGTCTHRYIDIPSKCYFLFGFQSCRLYLFRLLFISWETFFVGMSHCGALLMSCVSRVVLDFHILSGEKLVSVFG
jgi:hypothetical protein